MAHSSYTALFINQSHSDEESGEGSLYQQVLAQPHQKSCHFLLATYKDDIPKLRQAHAVDVVLIASHAPAHEGLARLSQWLAQPNG